MRKRRQSLLGNVMRFAQQYARKKTRGHDPNDRQYSRKVEQRVRRMKPEDLDRLLHGDADHP